MRKDLKDVKESAELISKYIPPEETVQAKAPVQECA